MFLKSFFENLKSFSSPKIYFKVKYHLYDIICMYLQFGKINLQYLWHYYYWEKSKNGMHRFLKQIQKKNHKKYRFSLYSRYDKGYISPLPCMWIIFFHRNIPNYSEEKTKWRMPWVLNGFTSLIFLFPRGIQNIWGMRRWKRHRKGSISPQNGVRMWLYVHLDLGTAKYS